MAACLSMDNYNTGVSGCDFLMKIARRLILVPKYDESGAVNEFANEAAVTKSALQAKFDHNDVEDRFFPLEEMENVEDTRAETVFYEWNSGNKVKIRKGSRTFTGIIPMKNPYLISKIESFNGRELGVYIIDADGNFVYNRNTDTTDFAKVQPIYIDGASLTASYVKYTDSDAGGILVQFDFDRNVGDEFLNYINASSLDFDGLSNNDVYGLIDVTTKLSSLAAGATNQLFTATLVDDYGNPVQGLVVGEFAATDESDDGAVALSTATETSAGVYSIATTAAQSSVTIRCYIEKAKYNFNESDVAVFTGGFTVTMIA